MHSTTPEIKSDVESEVSCNRRPDATHGFSRNASHLAGRYVCECEGWQAPTREELLETALRTLIEETEDICDRNYNEDCDAAFDNARKLLGVESVLSR